MADANKYKSVAVDIATYNKLKKISGANFRKVSQEIRRLTDEAYVKQFGNVTELGIGSAAKGVKSG